jgi:hypothetical protein
VYFDGAAFFMIYSRLVDQQWQLYGAVSSDGIAWQPSNAGGALLAASAGAAFDAAGPGRNMAVHPSQLLLEDNILRVWYMGEETATTGHQRIGLLQADLR